MRELVSQSAFCSCTSSCRLQWRVAADDCSSPKRQVRKRNEQMRRCSLQSISNWITFMVALTGVVKLTSADFGETLSSLDLVPASDARHVVQILTSPGDRDTLWAATVSVNATSTAEVTSIIFFKLYLNTQGAISQQLNVSHDNKVQYSSLYYNSQNSLVSFGRPVDNRYLLREYFYNAVSMSVTFTRVRPLCDNEPKINVIPQYVSGGYGKDIAMWQVVVCPNSSGRLQCTDAAGSGSTSGNATSYSVVGNGTLLVAAFAMGRNSLVCVYSIAGVNATRDATETAKVTLPGVTIVSTAVFELTPTKTIIFLSGSNGSITRWYLSINKARDQYLMYGLDGFNVSGSGARGTSITFVDNKLIVPVKNKLVVIDALDSCDYSNGSPVSCTSCVTWKNKYCGWCYSTSKCTTYANCSMGWIAASPYFTPSCPGTGVLSPNSAAVGSSAVVAMKFSRGIQSNSMCSFSITGIPPYVTLPTPGDDGNTLSCTVPNATYFQAEAKSFNVMFSIYDSGDSNVIFGAADFTYVDCSIQSSCASCLQAHSDCIWCKNEQTCLYSVTKTCPSGNASTVTSSDRKCPNIKSIGPRALPCSSAMQVINISVLNFPVLGAASYECKISGLATTKLSVKAVQNDASLITCEASMCKYMLNQFQAAAGVSLWGNNTFVTVNMGNSSEDITLYNCSVIKSCFDCNRKQTAFGLECIWCQSSGCSYRECPNSDTIVKTCLSPSIDRSKLELSSYVGGSNFTLVGWGLGDGVMEHVKDSIRVNSSVCTIVTYDKQSDRSDMNDSITCKVPRVSSRGNATLSVIFLNTTWNDSFYYYDPEITSVDKPGHGLVSGGIWNVIRGYDLDRIYTPEFTFYMKSPQSENINMTQCVLLSDSMAMNCSMPPVAANASGNYTFGLMRYDTDETEFRVLFIYYPDPEIQSLKPMVPKGTIRGGQMLTIIGNGFAGVVADPRLRLSATSATGRKRSLIQIYSVCNVVSQALMRCPIPNTEVELTPSSLPMTLLASLEMDSMSFKLAADVTIYPNPVVFNFTMPKQFVDTVVLYGSNLTMVYKRDDYSVLVNGVTCQVSEPAADALLFIPPALDRLINVTATSDRIFNITVVVDRFMFHPGSLSYSDSHSEPLPNNDQSPLIIGMSCGAVLVVAITIIAIVFFRKKAKYYATMHQRTVQQLIQIEFSTRAKSEQSNLSDKESHVGNQYGPEDGDKPDDIYEEILTVGNLYLALQPDYTYEYVVDCDTVKGDDNEQNDTDVAHCTAPTAAVSLHEAHLTSA